MREPRENEEKNVKKRKHRKQKQNKQIRNKKNTTRKRRTKTKIALMQSEMPSKAPITFITEKYDCIDSN